LMRSLHQIAKDVASFTGAWIETQWREYTIPG